MSDDYQPRPRPIPPIPPAPSFGPKPPRRPPVSRPNPSIPESRRPKRPTPKPPTVKRGDTDIEGVIGCTVVAGIVILGILWVALIFLFMIGAVRWVWSAVDDNHDDGAQVTTEQEYHR